jgi:cytosine deaminase
MGIADYGLEKGCNADLVILQASDALEALRLKPNRLAVIHRGKVIARSAPRIGELFLDGRPARIDGGLDYVPRY